MKVKNLSLNELSLKVGEVVDGVLNGAIEKPLGAEAINGLGKMISIEKLKLGYLGQVNSFPNSPTIDTMEACINRTVEVTHGQQS